LIHTAVVILNYNGRKLLEQFLPSVLTYTQDTKIVEIIVVDNASLDDSVDFLRANYPQVKLVILEKNYGFAGGYNVALQQIEADNYVLLNSDVEVTENWLSPLINLLDSKPNIAACQPKIKAYHNKTHFEHAGAGGGFIDYLGYPFCRGRVFEEVELDNKQYDDIVPIFWASGACLAIKAKVFHDNHGFDADFFAHMEEIDLCWRLKGLGYEIYYCGLSTVYHVGGGTLQTHSPRKSFLNFRNNLVMLTKNLPKNKLFTTLFIRMVLDGLAALQMTFKGQFWAIPTIIKAHFYLYANINKLVAKRKKVQQNIKEHKHKEIYPKSIVWKHFVKKEKNF
jgi:GT2 family glycosyltransferase